MRAPLSIIIPTLNAADVLPATLLSLFEGVNSGLVRELIVSDGGSQDATCMLAEEAGAGVVTGSASRGSQLIRGAERSTGEWFLFLHADTQLAEGWSDTVAQHIAATSDAGYFRLRFDTAGLAPRWVAGWANLRSRMFGLPYGDQGLLISRALYTQSGGYTAIPLMEDVAMARALRGRMTALNSTAITGAVRYLQEGWLRRGARNLMALAAYFSGTDPAELARRYRR